VAHLIELVGAVDGLLQKQTGFDIENLQIYLGRIFGEDEQAEVQREILKTKRWVFIESGVTHPKFAELFTHVTTAEQQKRAQQALAA